MKFARLGGGNQGAQCTENQSGGDETLFTFAVQLLQCESQVAPTEAVAPLIEQQVVDYSQREIFSRGFPLGFNASERTMIAAAGDTIDDNDDSYSSRC